MLVPRSARNDRPSLFESSHYRSSRRHTAAIMVNGRLKGLPGSFRDMFVRHRRPIDRSFPINRVRIDPPARTHERQSRPALAGLDLAVEARAAAGVAGDSGLLDPDPEHVLIAIEPNLDHALDVAGGFALSPQRVAGAAEVPGLAARDGLAQGFVIHMRDHQHLAR